MAEFGATDLLIGVEEIARFLKVSQRQVYYLCERKQLPAFKRSGRWCLRPCAYIAHMERLEAEQLSAKEPA